MDSKLDTNLFPEVQAVIKNFPNYKELHWQDQEWIKSKASFEYFAAKYIDILHPTQGLVKFNMYDYQKRCIQSFSSHRFSIVSKFRQGGLTTLASLWSLWRCMFMKHQAILVMSRTDAHAIDAGEIAKRAIENMAFENGWLAPELTENSKHRLVFAKTGSKMMFHSPQAARGKAARIMIIDEAAFISGMEEHWKSMYPVVSTGGSVIVISTVNGRGNWYEKTYTAALSNKNKFHVIDLDYKEHPEYCKSAWEEQARANMDKKSFAQEFERSFLGSGDTYISPEILTELASKTKFVQPVRKLYAEWDTDNDDDEDNWVDVDRIQWEKGALHIFQEPIESREYIIGADVAEGIGDGGDNSTFQIIDMASLEQVAEFSSNTVPPHIFAQILSIVGNYYNIAIIVVENVGPGLAVLQKLRHTLYYENIYYQQVRTSEKAGITTNRTTRPLILESMQNCLLNRFTKIKSKRLVSELDTFVFNKQSKRAEASRNHHDDLVMAFAIALHVRDASMRDVPMGIEIPDNVVDSFKTDAFDALKKEIERGSPIDLIEDDNKKEVWGDNEVLPGVVFDFKRPNDGLLKEFGW